LLPYTFPNPVLLDFHFWGYVKQIIYSVRIHNIKHMKQQISEAAVSVTADVLG
jgi:hypothetical protein